jgi:4-amino-4-deoxy-L-arabinose transferase-like glycosyltransferase
VHGDAYLRSFFIGDNLERFATSQFNDPRLPGYYVPVLVAQLLPWSPFLLLLAGPFARVLGRRRTVTAVEARLVAWAALPFLLFTVSIGQQPRYILPVLPPLAILLARAMHRRLRAPVATRSGNWNIRLCGALAGLVIVAVGWLVCHLRPLILDVPDNAVLTAAALTAIAGATVVAVSLSRAWRAVPLVLAVAAVVATLGAQCTVVAAPTPEAVERVASIVRANLRPGDRWATYDLFLRNLVFYGRAPERVHPHDDGGVQMLLEAQERVILVIGRDDLDRAEAKTGLRATRLGEVRYFNAADIKVERALSPDPARDIRTVLIVTNR